MICVDNVRYVSEFCFYVQRTSREDIFERDCLVRIAHVIDQPRRLPCKSHVCSGLTRLNHFGKSGVLSVLLPCFLSM